METQFWKDCGEQETIIFGSANGIYNIPATIKLAIKYGFKSNLFLGDEEDEEINENESACDECILAEYFLSSQLPDGYWYGSNEHTCDWGVWKVEPEEL